MKKIKEKWVNVGAWKADVVLFIGDRKMMSKRIKNLIHKDRYEKIKNMISKDVESSVDGEMYPMPGGGAIIWMKENDDKVLVHELMHTIHHMLGTKGMRLNDSSEEAYAYLLEYLYRELK